MAARPFAEGDTVLLLDRAGSRRLLRLKAGGRLHSHKGFVEHDRLIGADEGIALRTHTGAVFTAIRPRLADYVLEMPRNSAIVYPKDVGIILVWADIYPGATVLESGLGSGALTLALLRAVGPTGRVIVYETRADFIQLALTNIHGFGAPEVAPGGGPANLLVRERDIYQGIDEEDVGIDRLVLDLAEPWQVLPHAVTALRVGGIVACYSPSIIQVQQTVAALESARVFGQVESLEVLFRPWHVKGQAVRPVQQMVSHTGFLTFARRLIPGAAPFDRPSDAAEIADLEDAPEEDRTPP